jgi:hypothetical protein
MDEYQKRGITKIDIVHIFIIIIMIIIYIILLSYAPVSQTDENSKDNKSEVSTLDIVISIWGFILGLFVSSFVTRFIFREYNSNIIIISITFFIALTILILYYIGINYETLDNGNNWIRYNQVVFPLIGGLFLISEDAISHLFEYFGGNRERYTNLNKLAGGLMEIREALAKNNILSDTSTDYKGSSDISSEYFTTDSL